jgi:uncharacterized protein with von Willebrand factor type A (vWA) domain
LLTENFLLQYWQLRALHAALQKSDASRSYKVARELQRRLIFGLDEFYRSSLAFGSAQERVARLLAESGAERMQAQMFERFDQLGAITAAERAERAAGRATAATVAAFAAAVVFGLPAIDQTLTLVKKMPTGNVAGWLASPLRAVAELDTAGSYLAYLALLTALLLAIVLYALPRRRRRIHLRRHLRAGQSWPGGTIKIVRKDRNGQ